MKQILIEKTETISLEAGTRFYLPVTEKNLPGLLIGKNSMAKIDFPLDMKVLSGGEDYTLMMKLVSAVAMHGVVMLSADKLQNVVRAVFINLTDSDLSFEEGIPMIEASLIQAVAFRQIDSTVTSGDGTETTFENDVVVVKSKPEERRGEAQVRKARKKNKSDK